MGFWGNIANLGSAIIGAGEDLIGIDVPFVGPGDTFFGGSGPKTQARPRTPVYSAEYATTSGSGAGRAATCAPGFWEDASGNCVASVVPGTGVAERPTPGVVGAVQRFLPGGSSGTTMQNTSLVSPGIRNVETMVCPTFADGKKGLLWMDALSGQVICLPRGTNGKGFGLIRKNPPRRKAYITAADISELKSMARTKTKAKAFAKLTGQTCAPNGASRRK